MVNLSHAVILGSPWFQDHVAVQGHVHCARCGAMAKLTTLQNRM